VLPTKKKLLCTHGPEYLSTTGGALVAEIWMVSKGDLGKIRRDMEVNLILKKL
jgi:hypothetical protein